MVVITHTRFASDIAISSPLPFSSPCFSTIISGGRGQDEVFIISNSTLPIPFPINHSTFSLCV